MLRIVTDYIRLNRHFYHDSPRQIAAYQEKRLLSLTALVREKSPFYRSRYAGRRIAGLADFQALPTIDKSAMMAHFDEINTAGLQLAEVMPYAVARELAHDYLGYYQGRYVVGLSSGTSGNKGIYVTARRMTRRLPGLFLARGGVSLADLPLRILFILRVFSQGFDDINAPLIHLHYLSSMTPPEEIVAAINRMQINILMAPPSLLRHLLPGCGQINRPLRRVITYAEVLTPEEKQRFAQAFGSPVCELYQASEGQIASPCRCGNLHLNEDLVYVELFGPDGRTPVTGPGQKTGRMLVTNLVNTVQPLLRYEMNDIIELGERCPCGSHFRVVGKIVGRSDDVLYLPNGNGTNQPVYPDLVSRWIITTDDRIREFTVEQDAASHLTLTLDLSDAGSRPEEDRDIVSRLRQRLDCELAAFGLHGEWTIRLQAIALPADNRKLRRFVRSYQEIKT